METNEALKTVLWCEIEVEVLRLLEQVHDLPEGDLKSLERRVMDTVLAIGQEMMECILNRSERGEQAAARRERSCG